jgi:two-component system NtrC family sensor kinase
MSANRVLIIDDEEIVRDSIRGVLNPSSLDESELEDAAFNLFPEEEKAFVVNTGKSNLPNFTIEEASNGINGLEKVKKALEAGQPFQVIYLDMRMPGWDGLRTCVEIRKVDPKVQIYFVTAYTDRSIEEILKEAGHDVGYISKPFIAEEIIQLGTKAIYDWNKLTNLERLLKIIGEIGFGTVELNTLLVNILHQIADYIKSDFAVLGRFDKDNAFEEVAKIGIGENRINIEALREDLDFQQLHKITLYNGILICPMEHFCILAITSTEEHFNQEKLYLVELFVENAVRAVKTSELQTQLIQNERLSAVGQAIGMVMHDIRTPISQIDGMAQMIEADPANAEMNSELSVLMRESTAHAYDIIHDVLDFTKDAKVNLSTVNVNSFLKGNIKRAEADIAKNHEGKVTIVADLSTNDGFQIMLDSKKMDRVLINLINNAVEVLVDRSISSATITISSRQKGSSLQIRISDNGPGIPEEIKDDLFKPFITQNKENGTGLGLAIVQQIIDSHNGQISIEPSELGACFLITLPHG